MNAHIEFEVDKRKVILYGEIVGYLFNIGYSVCIPADKYNKELGLKVAIGRAKNNRSSFRIDIPYNFQSIIDKQLLKNILLAFKRNQFLKNKKRYFVPTKKEQKILSRKKPVKTKL